MGGFSTLGLSWDAIKQKLESEGAKNKAYDSDVDGVFDTEAIPDLDASKITSGVLDLARIPTIPRSKLEYPTEDVTLAYLASIGKVKYACYEDSGPVVVAYDTFTDKAIETITNPNVYPMCFARLQDYKNAYYNYYDPSASTADHVLRKIVDGSSAGLATESVDIDYTGKILCISCSGSTIKSLRYAPKTPVYSIADITPDGVISATDTSFASGYFGIRPIRQAYNHGFCDTASTKLLAPQTKLPQAKAIIEVDQLKQNLVPISQLDNVPDFLKQEYKKYELLKQKGFTDEEIQLLLGYIPQHQVDLASVTWGAFDHKPEHNTILITITGGNAYTGEKAIQEQIEHAKSKGLKVLSPPRDYNEAIEQYEMLKKDFPEWIAGRHNYCYQVLGHEDFEAMQVADTYYGNIIQGYKPDAYKRVPDFEMRRTLAMWKDRLKRATVIKSETEKHLKKLEEVEKKGW